MKTSNAVLTGLAVAVVVAGLAWAIDVDVSGESRMPQVEVIEGEMPDVNVDTVDVDVYEGERTMTVPTGVERDENGFEVETEERTIPYPEVDVTEPDASMDQMDIDGYDDETDYDTFDNETEQNTTY